MADEQARVRFTPEFLDNVDAYFGRERVGGRPHRADFYNEDLPLILQLLADDVDGNSFASDVPGERVLVMQSKFGGYLAVYIRSSGPGLIELIGLDRDEPTAATYD